MSKVIRHLDKNDLIFILADYFGVETKNVNVLPFITTEGYGPNEHDIASVRAEVDISNSEL